MSRGRPKKLNLTSSDRLEFDQTSTIFQCTLELLSPKTQQEVLSATYFDDLSTLAKTKFARAERRFKFSQRRPVSESSTGKGGNTSTPRLLRGVRKRLTTRTPFPTTPNSSIRTVFEESAEFEYDLNPNALSLSPNTQHDSISNLADNVIDLINDTELIGTERECESSISQPGYGNKELNFPV